MVTHPVIGSISNMLFNFNSSSQGYIERFPQLEVSKTNTLHANGTVPMFCSMFAPLHMSLRTHATQVSVHTYAV